MRKFRVGDRVIRIKPSHHKNFGVEGKIYTVNSNCCASDITLQLLEYPESRSNVSAFRLITDNNGLQEELFTL